MDSKEELEETLAQNSLSPDYSVPLKEITEECLAWDPDARLDAIEIYKRAEEYLKNADKTRPEMNLVAQKKDRLLPGAPIAAINWPGWHYRVYFQDSSGGIREARHDVGVWSGGDTRSVLCHAKLSTPLAVASGDDGKHIHLFYLAEGNILQELSYVEGSGWRAGRLNKLKMEVSPQSQLAALWLPSGIRLYFQEKSTHALQEYITFQDTTHKGCLPLRQVLRRPPRRPSWKAGSALQADTLRGTRLAAATWGGESIRLYYQDSGLELREHCCDNAAVGGWYVGHMAVGTIPRRAPISAFAWSDRYGGINIHIYWLDAKKNLTEVRWLGGWRPVRQLVFMGNTEISAVQWQEGAHIRAYYQNADHHIMEKCFSNGNWYNGSRVDDTAELDAPVATDSAA